MEIDKIYLGDCLEFMKEIPDKSVDCIICDLPYGITDCEFDSIIPFDLLWEQYNRISELLPPKGGGLLAKNMLKNLPNMVYLIDTLCMVYGKV